MKGWSALFALGLLAAAARADDAVLLSGRLTVRAQKVVLKARGDGVHADAPPFGPSTTGATLAIRERDRPDNVAVFDLPGGSGWVVDTAARARYVNRAAPSGGGVKVASLRAARNFKIVALSLGDAATLDVAGGPVGALEVTLTVGAHRLCIAFDAGRWTPLPDGGARLRATAAASGTCPPSTTTTTTLPGRPADCIALTQPPGSCETDEGCPLGYTCLAGECSAGSCAVRADCPREGECVYDGDVEAGVCVCRGCGPQACPRGCRHGFVSSGCRCDSEQDCPPEDDVCFAGLCS